MNHLLRRLRRTTPREVAWRARVAGRTAADRVARHLRTPAWDRSRVRDVLTAEAVDTDLETAIDAEQWHVAHVRLAEKIRARGSRFALDPSTATAVRERVLAMSPGAAIEAAARAGAILEGRYDVLGYRGLTYGAPGGAVDWHVDPVHHRRPPMRFWADVPYLDPANGDHKIIWELNRHQHWMVLGRAYWLTGDERYAARIIGELGGWLAANPPLTGVNWASMLELGFRSMSWMWGLNFLLRDPGPGIRDPRNPAAETDPGPPISDPGSRIPDPEFPWLIDLLVAIDRQLRHVERNLSIYFSPNTHLTGEALALYVAGVGLPELRGSQQWKDTGRRILLEEINKQVYPDGGHAERSTHYQRYTLDFYLMALRTARVDGDSDAEGHFADAAGRLAEFTRTIADDAGRLPLIGDDDGGMLWPLTGADCADVRESLDVAATLLHRPELSPWGPRELSIWVDEPSHLRTLAPSDAPSHPRTLAPSHLGVPPMMSRLFADTGYAVLRDGGGDHAVFDVGLHGYMNAGHAHADALSMTLSIGGRPLLVDPGTATYTMDPALRDRFRSTASHNTVTVDGRSQSIPRGPFHWQTQADATLHGFRSYSFLDWVEASHDGYAPLIHRRSVVRAAESGWLIVDEILGEGEHMAEARWHFDPRLTLRCDAPGRLRASYQDGNDVWVLHDAGEPWLARGDEARDAGWFAPVYGTVVPTWTAGVAQRASAPFAMATWIVPAAAADPPALERLEGTEDTSSIGVRLRAGRRASVVLLRPARPAAFESHNAGVLHYVTDARILHAVEDGDRMRQIDLVDVMHLRARRPEILITASEPMADLRATIREAVLDLEASRPPAHLRVEGAPIRGAFRVRLNGRELAAPSGDRLDGFSLARGDWGDPLRT